MNSSKFGSPMWPICIAASRAAMPLPRRCREVDALLALADGQQSRRNRSPARRCRPFRHARRPAALCACAGAGIGTAGRAARSCARTAGGRSSRVARATARMRPPPSAAGCASPRVLPRAWSSRSRSGRCSARQSADGVDRSGDDGKVRSDFCRASTTAVPRARQVPTGSSTPTSSPTRSSTGNSAAADSRRRSSGRDRHTSTALACSRVAVNVTPGQRSCVSCRFTRDGAR